MEEAQAAAPPRARRALRRGQELLPARGPPPSLPRGLEGPRRHARHRPFQSLAQALAPAFAGDADAFAALLRFEEPDTAVSLSAALPPAPRARAADRRPVRGALHPLPARGPGAFASLLGRLVHRGGRARAPVAARRLPLPLPRARAARSRPSDLTILGPLGESALRRALVQPALTCGYRFEDEALVDEMIGAVAERARRAAASRLRRLAPVGDARPRARPRSRARPTGRSAASRAPSPSTRRRRSSASARSAPRSCASSSATSSPPRAPAPCASARSCCRSTPPGAAGPRPEAGPRVLDALVDARLLTSYERAGEAARATGRSRSSTSRCSRPGRASCAGRRRTQDGAQLRDQLRQAARLWHDRGEPDDLLWSGQAYRDFALWRER